MLERRGRAPDTGGGPMRWEDSLIGRRRGIFVVALASGLILAVPSHASEPGSRPDKSQFHLFNPTPREFMREMDTDRPDQTESPISVDAGHFQIEADIFSYSYSKQGNTRQKDFIAPALNLKVGLLNSVDLQVILNPFTHTRIEDHSTSPTTVSTASGFGDMQVRTKFNLWGNDGGSTALAVMPFVHIPTGAPGLTSEDVQGGVIFPFNVDLPGGVSAGMMWEVDAVRDSTGGGYHPEFIQTLTLNRGLTERLGAYVELFSLVSTEDDSGWQGMFDFGFNYLVNRNLKFDAGLNIGFTESAPDLVPFVGVTWRY